MHFLPRGQVLFTSLLDVEVHIPNDIGMRLFFRYQFSEVHLHPVLTSKYFGNKTCFTIFFFCCCRYLNGKAVLDSEPSELLDVWLEKHGLESNGYTYNPRDELFKRVCY